MAQGARGPRLRRHESADRVHRRAVGAEALAVPDEASDPSDRDASCPRSFATRPARSAFPPEAQAGDYDLVLLASPTWWFQTSMPIRSYLESPAAKTILDGKPFATRVDLPPLLQHQPQATERSSLRRTAGGSIDKTHFVVAGGQVKSMLSWLGYMKHGEPQKRVFGLNDAAAQSQARLRGPGKQLRGRPRGPGSPSARRRWRGEPGPWPSRDTQREGRTCLTSMTVFLGLSAVIGVAALARARALRARKAPDRRTAPRRRSAVSSGLRGVADAYSSAIVFTGSAGIGICVSARLASCV